MEGNAKAIRVGVFITWQYPTFRWVCLDTNRASKGNPGKANAGGLSKIARNFRDKLWNLFVYES